MRIPDERLRSLRRLALPLAALSFVVVALSSYLRLDYAGLGCADWPACYGQLLAEPARAGSGIARALHRITASLALVLTLVITWKALRPTPIQPVARYATLLLLLMLTLSAIGIVSDDPHLVLVGFLNILGGLGLVSFACRVLMATDPAPLPRSMLNLDQGLMRVGIYSLTATLILGSLIGARYAATACTGLPDCGDSWWPAAAGWAALNPLVILASATPVVDAGGIALHLLHRYLALATLILLGTACCQGLRQAATRRGAQWILLLLGMEVALGIATVASGFSLWIAIAHGLCAAALLVAIARQQVTRRQHQARP